MRHVSKTSCIIAGVRRPVNVFCWLGWNDATSVGRLDEGMFVARAKGRSMEPEIHDGDLPLLFQQFEDFCSTFDVQHREAIVAFFVAGRCRFRTKVNESEG